MHGKFSCVAFISNDWYLPKMLTWPCWKCSTNIVTAAAVVWIKDRFRNIIAHTCHIRKWERKKNWNCRSGTLRAVTSSYMLSIFGVHWVFASWLLLQSLSYTTSWNPSIVCIYPSCEKVYWRVLSRDNANTLSQMNHQSWITVWLHFTFWIACATENKSRISVECIWFQTIDSFLGTNFPPFSIQP